MKRVFRGQLQRGGWRVWGCLLLSLVSLSQARVYTTRNRNSATLENPSSFGAKPIYSGHFRVNGSPAELEILAARFSALDVLRTLKESDKAAQDNLRCRASRGTVVGAVGRDEFEKRFLISSMGGDRSCLVFILRGDRGLFSGGASSIPWPKTLPELDPLQRPQIVVEHMDAEFIFACVLTPRGREGQTLESFREKWEQAGWAVESFKGEAPPRMSDSSFAVLGKKGKTCWMNAKPDPFSDQTCVTLLCKIP